MTKKAPLTYEKVCRRAGIQPAQPLTPPAITPHRARPGQPEAPLYGGRHPYCGVPARQAYPHLQRAGIQAQPSRPDLTTVAGHHKPIERYVEGHTHPDDVTDEMARQRYREQGLGERWIDQNLRQPAQAHPSLDSTTLGILFGKDSPAPQCALPPCGSPPSKAKATGGKALTLRRPGKCVCGAELEAGTEVTYDKGAPKGQKITACPNCCPGC